MNAYRKTAVIVGVLYIVGTVSGILSVVATGTVLAAPNSPSQINANANQLIVGAMLVLTMGLALAMVPVMMYPILKKYNPVLAVGYVVFRGTLETFACLVLAISWLVLGNVSQAYVQAGAADVSAFQASSALLVAVGATNVALSEIVFSFGALMLYSMLFQSRLIPRWISVWGLVAVVPYLMAALLDVVGLTDSESAMSSIMFFPMLIQEMVMALWMIVKGFNPSAIAETKSGRTTFDQAPVHV